MGFAEVDEFHLDAGRRAKRREVEIGIGRRAVGLLEVAGQGDAEFVSHLPPPISACTVAQLAHRVRERLVQNPDVAGIADEIEALTVEIDAQLDIRHEPAKRLIVLLRRRDRRLDRLLEFGMVELAGNAERDRQVEMADPQAIDAVDRRHLLGVLHAFGGFDLAEEGGAHIGGGEFVGDRARPVAVMGDLQGDAALARRVILHRVDDVANLVDIADHRQHQTLGAHIHGAGDVMVFARGHAHDRRQRRRLEIADRALDRLETEAGMLQVEQDELAAGRFQDVADAGRRELDDERAEFRRLGRGHGFEAWVFHSFLPTHTAPLSRRSPMNSILPLRPRLRKRGHTGQPIFR